MSGRSLGTSNKIMLFLPHDFLFAPTLLLSFLILCLFRFVLQTLKPIARRQDDTVLSTPPPLPRSLAAQRIEIKRTRVETLQSGPAVLRSHQRSVARASIVLVRVPVTSLGGRL